MYLITYKLIMETFIAFFDVLGFKEFINNNKLEEAIRLFDNLLMEAQLAIAHGKTRPGEGGMAVPDLADQKVNCLHISDSIIFWTNCNEISDFEELVNVCHQFYWRSLQTTFPIRGALVYGELHFKPFNINNTATFYNSSLIGKGLVDAYLKAESIEYAGCILDDSAIKKVSGEMINNLIYDQKICLYKVPFKTGPTFSHVFRPVKGNHNDVSFRNLAIRVMSLFTFPSKIDLNKLPESVKLKMNNTIDFIGHFRDTDPDLKRP